MRLPTSIAAAAALGLAAACSTGVTPAPLGSPRETISDLDHGAAAAAVDAMNTLSTDLQPDTEIHLVFTPARSATADDSTRADLLLVRIRGALRKYVDVRAAAADGFEELPGNEGPHAMHHLLNWGWAAAEARTFDPARPTALLYREGTDGTLRLTGAMYTAPASSSNDQLDRRLPLGVTRWHRHVNWCAPGSGSGVQWLATQDSSPVYGPRSPIANRASCDAVAGVFYPGIFGWMVHVTFVGSDDPTVVWGGYLPLSAADSGALPDTMERPHPRPVMAPPEPLVATPNPLRAAASVAGVQIPRVVGNPPSASSALGRHPATGPTATISASMHSPLVPSPQPPAPSHPTVFATGGRSSSSFVSGGRAIAYDRFTPLGAGRHPVILLLHADGGLSPQADRFQEFATALVQRGYLVEIVHYFDRTGTIAVAAAERPTHFREWFGTVRDAMADAARAPGADSTRLGLFGTGLGGTLALAVGAQDDRVRAIVEYGGAMPSWAVPTVRRMPAVFIGQSDAGKAGGAREAYRIRAVCQAANAPFELDIFTGQKRIGRGGSGADLRQKTFAFFEKYLSRAP